MGSLRVRTIQKLKSGVKSRPILHEIIGNRGNTWRNLKINYKTFPNIEVSGHLSNPMLII